MNDLQKYLSTCLFVTVALLGGVSPSFAAAVPSPGTASEVATLAKAIAMLAGVLNPPQSTCNQGVGNGSEDCDPGNSNQGDASRSNDQSGVPGSPGRKGGNK